MLLAELPGARFLDLFAGTGAVGIEAVSRGAGDVTWVEGDRAVHRLAVQNVSTIAGEACARNVVCSDVARWIRTAGRGAAYGIVFADPHYVQAKGGGFAQTEQSSRVVCSSPKCPWTLPSRPFRAGRFCATAPTARRALSSANWRMEKQHLDAASPLVQLPAGRKVGRHIQALRPDVGVVEDCDFLRRKRILLADGMRNDRFRLALPLRSA